MLLLILVEWHAYILLACDMEIFKALFAKQTLRYSWHIDWRELFHEVYEDFSIPELHWCI